MGKKISPRRGLVRRTVTISSSFRKKRRVGGIESSIVIRVNVDEGGTAVKHKRVKTYRVNHESLRGIFIEATIKRAMVFRLAL